MNNFIKLFLSLFLCLNFAGYAQLTVKDQDSTPNTLLQVNDEGNYGSIYFPYTDTYPVDQDNKLFNYLGELYWNGNQVGTSFSGAGWTYDGTNILTKSIADKVGIGITSAPVTALHVNGNDGVLFEGVFGSGSTLNLGAGTRMMWYPKKAAFRAGLVVGIEWDDSNIGEYSFAAGYGTSATGDASSSFGIQSTAAGLCSFAAGDGANAEGAFSSSFGYSSHAIGDLSTSFGNNTFAESYLSLVFGKWNIGGGSPQTWINTDPLFEIGNGTSLTPSNALTVLKNGNVGVGIHNPTQKLQVDKGNILVQGLNSSLTAGDEGILYLGTIHHYIKGVFGFGLKLGTYAAADALVIEEISGNVGVGTTDPDAKLEVNGDVKIGTSGIKFSEIYEITGTTSSTGTSTSISFPSGYNMDNIRILNLEVIHPTFGWYSLGTTVGLGGTLHYIIDVSGITIHYEDIALFKNKEYRILLMKVG